MISGDQYSEPVTIDDEWTTPADEPQDFFPPGYHGDEDEEEY